MPIATNTSRCRSWIARLGDDDVRVGWREWRRAAETQAERSIGLLARKIELQAADEGNRGRADDGEGRLADTPKINGYIIGQRSSRDRDAAPIPNLDTAPVWADHNCGNDFIAQ